MISLTQAVISQIITPIPFTVEDDSTLEPLLKRISRLAACIQSPYVISFPSQGNANPNHQTVNFQYEFCLDVPDISNYVVFENWYGKRLRLGNNGDCGIFIIKYAEYIFQKKIMEMSKKFDTHMARYNMAVQLYKYMLEKSDLPSSRMCN
ncbi:Ulp1 protease family [Abeliophyllum distichum]|uniref:Ulp1 protease family n=1 Tax=Abeliophyllum distichum TaxID=126358 RepID=A0ABD1SHE3_9LAMI